MEEWIVNVTPRPLYAKGKDPVHIVQEAAWAPRPWVWSGAENLTLTGIRCSDHAACSESLYRLSYSGPTEDVQRGKNMIKTLLETEITRIRRNLPIKEEWHATGKFAGPLCCSFTFTNTNLTKFANFPKIRVCHAFRLPSYMSLASFPSFKLACPPCCHH